MSEATDTVPPLAFVHPGALAPTVYEETQRQYPGQLVLINLERNHDYVRAALTGDTGRLAIDDLVDDAIDVLRSSIDLSQSWNAAGWSFGGVVANALIARLEPEERPRGLLLYDSIAAVPGYVRELGDAEDLQPADRAQVLGWFAMYLSAKKGVDLGMAEGDFTGLDGQTGIELVLDRALERGLLSPGTSIDGIGKVFEVFVRGLRRNNQLAGEHTAPHSTVPVALFRPEKGLLPGDPHLGWNQVCPHLTVADVPGDHYSMVDHPDVVSRAVERLIAVH